MPIIAIENEVECEDTSSEGCRDAIDATRVADEQNMVEVRDNSCSQKIITLCEMGTQTETPDMSSPALNDISCQASVPVCESATQMSPPIKVRAVARAETDIEAPQITETTVPIKHDGELAIATDGDANL